MTILCCTTNNYLANNMPKFEPKKFRKNFPLLTQNINEDNNKPIPLIYFDNGATTQKPQCVINSYSRYFNVANANVHRASHFLSSKATLAFEQSRTSVQKFINAKNTKEIIWTKGTTESINLVAQCYGREQLNKGDEIVLSYGEHHANIVPWQIVAQQTGAVIKVLPLNNEGIIDCSNLSSLITANTKIVACSHISNVLGFINPIEKVIQQAKKVGAVTLIDGAQAIGHFPVDVQSLNCDFYVFSAHKMYGPTGVGVLYGKEALLTSMPPYQGGGEMITKVNFETGAEFNELPFKFEAGTPNIAGVVAFSDAILFLKENFDEKFVQYERFLSQYLVSQLIEIEGVDLLFSKIPDIPIVGFTLKGIHNHDVAAQLNACGIAVRSGHHCAMPLMDYLSVSGCIRVSLSAYNTQSEIDFFIAKLNELLLEHKGLEVSPIAIQENRAPSNGVSNCLSEEIVRLFETLKGWDKKHRQIMLLSKKLPQMTADKRGDESLINGCESLAWLSHSKNNDGIYTFEADSNAKVIRGLLFIVLSAYNNKTQIQINAFDIDDYFQTLGLLQHLSPSRGNGVKAIVNKIKAIVNNG